MEFEDEEQHATVTVVEDFDVDILGDHQPSRLANAPDPEAQEGVRFSTTKTAPTSHRSKPSGLASSSKPSSAPKKKGRPAYQTKSERRSDKLKQKAKRTEKADDEKMKRKMSGAGSSKRTKKTSRGKKGQRGPGHLKKARS